MIKKAAESGHVANQCGGFFLVRRSQTGSSAPEGIEVAYLSEWDTFFKGSDVYVGFLDPSPSSEILGWPLRNLLYYASHFKGLDHVKILSIHQHVGVSDFFADTKVMRIGLGRSEGAPVAVGWEPGAGTTKLSSRVVDVSGTLDPLQRASAAVNLNLQLMRWRAEPAIDLPTIANARCLVLGAGTLGSYVARNLLVTPPPSTNFRPGASQTFRLSTTDVSPSQTQSASRCMSLLTAWREGSSRWMRRPRP